MLRIILILTYVILFTSSCNNDKDVSTQNNLELAKLLDRIADINPNEKEAAIKRTINLASTLSNIHDSTLIKTYYQAGNYFHKIGKIDNSSIFYQKAIGFINDSIHTKLQIKVFQRAHQAYKSLGAYEECAAISTKFASLIDMDKDTRNMATYYAFKAEYYKSNPYKYIDSILKYNQFAIDMLQVSNDKNQIDNLLVSRAGHISNYLRDYQRSSEIFDALISREDELQKDTKRFLYGDYGIQKFYQEDFESAIKYYKKGLTFIDNFVDKRNNFAAGYGNIAEAYLELNDFENASLYLDSLRSVGQSGMEERFQFFLKKLELELEFKKEKDIKKSLKSIKEYASELRNLNAEKYKSDLITLEQTLENRKEVLEESNLRKLKNNNLRWYISFLGVLLIGLSIFAYFFYKQKKVKFELKQMLLHQRLLRSQMNPHFTYNFLSIVQNLIKSNPLKASQYLLKFSRLLRMILDNSTYNYVELSTEMEILSKYIELQALRYPNGLSLESSYTRMNADDAIFIPPMMLQPILENCIVHGFTNNEHSGKITIRMTKEKKILLCEIEDNGSGMNQKFSIDQKRKSSTQLISEFLEKVTKSKLKFINKTDGSSGTIVSFSLPFKYTNFD